MAGDRKFLGLAREHLPLKRDDPEEPRLDAVLLDAVKLRGAAESIVHSMMLAFHRPGLSVRKRAALLRDAEAELAKVAAAVKVLRKWNKNPKETP